MYIENVQTTLNEMIDLKKENNYFDSHYSELTKLTSFSGVWELKFKKNLFKMINIINDDLVPLKYFWKDKYEQLSLNLWYEFTRDINSLNFDVGSHTGIYTIIGNQDKKQNNIISLEPYYINYSRMLSNLKLNDISLNNSFLCAASNENGVAKFKTTTHIRQHTSGGSIQQDGNHSVKKMKLDNFDVGNKKIGCIKIDTEGHEYEVLQGSEKIIKKFRPKIIFEINEESAQNCLDFLLKCDYEFYLIDDKGNKLSPLNEDNNYSIKLDNEGINCLAIKYCPKERKSIQRYI